MPEWVRLLAEWADRVHLHYLVPVVVLVTVLFLFGRTLVPFRGRLRRLEREIDGALKLLSSSGPDDQKRRAVEEYFEADRRDALGKKARETLHHHWKEFKESFVRVDGVYRNTIDAAHFFNADDIVDGDLGSEFNRHAPGIFTAIGIVGTFFGIAIGLIQATVKLQGDLDTKGVTEATRALLTPVGPAFAASFVAVLLAVVFLWVERHLVRDVKGKLLKLQIGLDGLYERAKPEDYFEEHLTRLPRLLEELRDNSEQQTTQLKKAVTDLTPALEEALQRMVEQQSQQMQSANQALVAQIALTVSQNLQPVSENLKQAVTEMKHQQADSTTEAIQKLVEEFSRVLSTGAQTEVNALASAVSKAAALLESQREGMEDYVAQTGQQMQRQTALLEEQIARLSEQARQDQSQSVEGLRAFLHEMTEALSTAQQQSVQQATGSLDKAGQDLQELVRRSLETQQTVSAQLTSRVEELSQQIAQQMQEVVKQMTSSTAESSNSIAIKQEEAVSRLTDLLASSQSTMQTTLQELLERMEGSTRENLEAVARSLAEASSQATREVAERTESTVEGLRGTVDECLERIAGTTERLLNASESTNRELLVLQRNLHAVGSREL